MKMRGVPCSVQKNNYGYWVISDFDNRDHLVTKRYLYYTKKEAIRLFKQELKQINIGNNQQVGATK
jgi:hypothetical protein